MSLYSPQEIAALTVSAGEKKSQTPLLPLLVLGFLAGAFIATGFLLDIHVIATLPAAWGSLATFLGASVFPVGLILTILAGGELLTGNMMALPMALFARRIGVGAVIKNWVLITLANFVGSIAVAYFFGHFLGMTEGAFLAKTVGIAQAKISADFWHAFVSGVGCNWLVCLGVWLGFASKDVAGKILGIWFPVMAFVAIGFQHVVANMFVVPAAIFAGAVTWGQYLPNFVAVFLGNAVGGALFVGLAYHMAYRPQVTAAATAAVSANTSANKLHQKVAATTDTSDKQNVAAKR
ncbi:formate/nitrite transporter family protein [Phytohalomonas tamaricis]|uniref:formate/nitrite transporter family protein n=1 Tax=Phytohalomonas tamaricis TaxID=2081032 RepID=UPI000D0BDE51|nr:formate/nitrite transporter family protein [Phytohalomonas tamaricis]